MTTVEEIPAVIVHQEEEESKKVVENSQEPESTSNGAQVEELQNLSLESEAKSENSDKQELENVPDSNGTHEEVRNNHANLISTYRAIFLEK